MLYIMKRTAAVLLSAAIALTASACSLFSPDQNDPQATSAKETAAASQTEPESGDPQELLKKTVKQKDFSGVVYITKGGEKLCESVTGFADSDSGRLINIETQFCIASVSKQFTAACIMLLQEQGLLSVYDTLDGYFPEYNEGADITIQSLLTMTSGIPDHTSSADNPGRAAESPDELGYSLSPDASPGENRAAALDWIFSEPLMFEPGSQYNYCNTNYLLLAQIVEQVSGESYEDFVTENIFDPLGMVHTGFAESIDDFQNLALTPAQNDREQFYGIVKSGIARGAGDIVSTARDLDLWLTSLREYTVLSPESVEEMTKDYSPGDNSYGYGLVVNLFGGFGHSGQIGSYASFAYTNPDAEYNFFAVTNDSGSMFGEISELAAKIIEDTMT